MTLMCVNVRLALDHTFQDQEFSPRHHGALLKVGVLQ